MLPEVDREGGFLVLWRRIQSWPIWRSFTAQQRMVVVQVLFAANYKPSTIWRGDTEVVIARGQFVDTEETIAKRAKVSRKVVRTVYERLEAGKFMEREKGHHAGPYPRITTILNYDRYQTPEKREGQQEGQSGANIGPTAGQQRAPSEPREPDQPREPVTAPRAAAPPAAGGEAKGKGKKAPDPRHAPLVAKLADDFNELRQDKYGFRPADARAVTELLRLAGGAGPAEVSERWRKALRLGGQWPGCSSLASLPARWNDLAGGGQLNGTKHQVTQAPSPASAFGAGGRIEL